MDVRTRQKSFTLIETTITLSILSVLLFVSFSTLYPAYIRCQITKCHTEYRAIRNAILQYAADYSCYPMIHDGNDIILYIEIQHFLSLTTPVSYINPVPIFPWYGKEAWLMEDNKITGTKVQMNYKVNTLSSKSRTVYVDSFPVWSICSGGPMGINTGSVPQYWYSPSNGLLSMGGFWMDANQRMNL